MLSATIHATLLGCAVLAFAGCDTALGETPDGGGTRDAPASCRAADGYSDLPTIETRILKSTCAIGSRCHAQVGDAGPAEMLDLLPGVAYAALVNVPSAQAPDLLLVEPFRPDRSYLMIKLGEGDQSLRKKTIMPLGVADGICVQKRDAIRRWIEAGASPEPPDAAPPDAAPLDAVGVDAAGPDASPVDAPQADAS